MGGKGGCLGKSMHMQTFGSTSRRANPIRLFYDGKIPSTTPDESTAPPSSPKRRRRRRGRRSKAATEAPVTPHGSSTRRRRRRRRRRRGNPPCTEAQAQSQVEQSRPTPPRADAPLFNPKQEEQPDHEGEDGPCNHETQIWIPSVRALVDTVTGRGVFFGAAVPVLRVSGRPASPGAGPDASTMLCYGDADTPRLPH